MSEDKKIHPLQLAWAGGVFDAKGTVPYTGYVLRLEHTDEPLVRRFRDTFGVGSVTTVNKKGMVKSLHIFQATNADATREILLAISPFLGPVKLGQAGEAVSRIERSPAWRKKHPEKAESLDTDLA